MNTGQPPTAGLIAVIKEVLRHVPLVDGASLCAWLDESTYADPGSDAGRARANAMLDDNLTLIATAVAETVTDFGGPSRRGSIPWFNLSIPMPAGVTPPPAARMTKTECAARVRAAVEALNDAVDAAAENGIAVSFGILCRNQNGIGTTRVFASRIERLSNRLAGDKGEEL